MILVVLWILHHRSQEKKPQALSKFTQTEQPIKLLVFFFFFVNNSWFIIDYLYLQILLISRRKKNNKSMDNICTSSKISPFLKKIIGMMILEKPPLFFLVSVP